MPGGMSMKKASAAAAAAAARVRRDVGVPCVRREAGARAHRREQHRLDARRGLRRLRLRTERAQALCERTLVRESCGAARARFGVRRSLRTRTRVRETAARQRVQTVLELLTVHAKHLAVLRACPPASTPPP